MKRVGLSNSSARWDNLIEAWLVFKTDNTAQGEGGEGRRGE